jgi:hypothetical protein
MPVGHLFSLFKSFLLYHCQVQYLIHYGLLQTPEELTVLNLHAINEIPAAINLGIPA